MCVCVCDLWVDDTYIHTCVCERDLWVDDVCVGDVVGPWARRLKMRERKGRGG